MGFIRRGNSLKNILWLQWITAFGTMTMQFTLGLMIGWTSPFLAKLTSGNLPLSVTANEASWVASLFNFGRFIGAALGGIFVQSFGCKRTLILIGFPLILSWIFIILANSVIWLYVARLAAGLSLGMSFSTFTIFIGEISSPSIRGALVSLAMTGIACGTVVGNAMGPYISMTVFSYIGLIPNVAFTLFFLWVPDSPHYLVRVGRIEDAKQSITRYNPQADPKLEIEYLSGFATSAESLTFKDRLREFTIQRNRKAGIIVLILFFFMQFSGINSVMFYSEILIIASKVTVIRPATVVVIAGVVGIVSGWITVYIADKLRRKTLMISSSAGVGLGMSGFAIHFTLLNNGFDPNSLQWLPITAITLFTFSACGGVVTVPNIMVSELFAPNIKNLAACLGSIAVGMFSFAAAKSFQPLVDVIGEAYVFWIHAVLMVLLMIFTALFMPETTGKSLQEIQDLLMQK